MIELGITPTLIQPVILWAADRERGCGRLSRQHYLEQLHALKGENTLLEDTVGALHRCRSWRAPDCLQRGPPFMVAVHLKRAGRPRSNPA